MTVWLMKGGGAGGGTGGVSVIKIQLFINQNLLYDSLTDEGRRCWRWYRRSICNKNTVIYKPEPSLWQSDWWREEVLGVVQEEYL